MSESEEIKVEGQESAEAGTEQVSGEAAESNEDRPGKIEGLAEGDAPEFKWYVVHVLSGYENRVTKTLKERILNHNMGEFFSDIFVPEETVVTNVNGKKRNIKKKFFPGYVLVKMNLTDETWHLVKDTDKITGFIGGERSKPRPITDEEAAFMLRQAQDGYKRPKSSTQYSTGDSVKVIEGHLLHLLGQ